MATVRNPEVTNLQSLGAKKTNYDFSGPKVEILETFDSPVTKEYIVRFVTEEFTSLCPKTGQPDFASIEILYVPNKKCIESKSLKLYLFSYRNFGSFMETITNRILNDLVSVCKPRWMKVVGSFNARGGISTDVIAEYKNPSYNSEDVNELLRRMR